MAAVDSSVRVNKFINMPSKAQLFCESTSIRGMQKISKSPTRFLQLLWFVFLCFMTCLLLSGAANLVYNYQLYETAWHAKTIIDDKESPFPDITLCSHIPFALSAQESWSAKGDQHIMSPREFQTRIFNLTLTMLNGFQENRISREEHNYFYRLLASYDNIDTYYSSLTLEQSKKIGHAKDMLFLCVVYEVATLMVDEKCEMIHLNIRQISHNEYLNCYTIQPNINFITIIERINLIVKLVPASQLANFLKDSFYMEAFNRGEGLKVVIHEHGTYPDFGRKGFNIEPGKMNEITYQTIKSELKHTPVKTCTNYGPQLTHLDSSYNYTQQLCLENNLQKKLIEKCNCQMSSMARPVTPDITPYCFSFTKANYSQEQLLAKYNQVICASNFNMQSKLFKETAQKTICLPRCNFVSYKTDLSITQWHPAYHTLDMMTRVTEIYSGLEKSSRHSSKENNLEHRLRNLLISNHEKENQTMSRYASLLNNSNAFTYVNLKRNSFDSILKTEKLVLDSSILASRIGGLCSLCIGLTAAFVCEIIEFIYLIIFPIDSKDSNNISKHCNNCNKSESPTTIQIQNNGKKINQEKEIFNCIMEQPSKKRSSKRKPNDVLLNEDEDDFNNILIQQSKSLIVDSETSNVQSNLKRVKCHVIQTSDY